MLEVYQKYKKNDIVTCLVLIIDSIDKKRFIKNIILALIPVTQTELFKAAQEVT